MILEVAILNIKKGQSNSFEKDFQKAKSIISSMKGYVSHQLKKKIDKEDTYLLLVNWETIEAHKEGFRKSQKYLKWKELLHNYYEPFPTVEYYK